MQFGNHWHTGVPACNPTLVWVLGIVTSLSLFECFYRPQGEDTGSHFMSPPTSAPAVTQALYHHILSEQWQELAVTSVHPHALTLHSKIFWEFCAFWRTFLGYFLFFTFGIIPLLFSHEFICLPFTFSQVCIHWCAIRRTSSRVSMQSTIVLCGRVCMKTLIGNPFCILLTEIPISLLAPLVPTGAPCASVQLLFSETFQTWWYSRQHVIRQISNDKLIYNTMTYLPLPFLNKGDEFLCYYINERADTHFSAQHMWVYWIFSRLACCSHSILQYA